MRPLRRHRVQVATVRLAVAGAVAVGGAYLIALWVVGVVLIAEAVFYVLVVWDDGKPVAQNRHGTILEQYWRTP